MKVPGVDEMPSVIEEPWTDVMSGVDEVPGADEATRVVEYSALVDWLSSWGVIDKDMYVLINILLT